ncbi:DUF2798 domain-containing protein [Alteromonas sp. 5E99-2]|nr:DUF2798 domain-containing protein [Alteromonas sp. 5E99-2]
MLERTVFALFMSLLLSFLMSGWVTFINLGLRPEFITAWGQAFMLAWPAAAIISFGFGPTVQTFSRFFVKKIEMFQLQTRKGK